MRLKCKRTLDHGLPPGVPEVVFGVNPELAAESLVRRLVILVVIRVERGVIGKRGDVLNPTHLKQDPPDSKIDVKPVDSYDLWWNCRGGLRKFREKSRS